MQCYVWSGKKPGSMYALNYDSVTSKKRWTKHTDDGTKVIKKPKVVEDYNQYMRGMDKSDQLILCYGFAHRRVKWQERAFFHLMDLWLVYIYILYNNHSVKKLTQLEFRTVVGKSLLDGFWSHILRHFVSVDLLLRLTERAFPEPIPIDTPHWGCPQCKVHPFRKKRDQNINV